MTRKIINFLGILFISLFLCLPAAAAAKSTNVEKIESYSSNYIYVRVYENGIWYIYVYESDGVTLVTIIEEEW
jgi:hypothetical protein